jgi:hypothetical protein
MQRCRYEYANEFSSSEELLVLAQTSRDMCVLRELAEHPKTPMEALKILLTDDLFARLPYKLSWDEETSRRCVFTDLIRNLGSREPLEPELAELLWQRESDYRPNYNHFPALEEMVHNLSTPEHILGRIRERFLGDKDIYYAFEERYEWEAEITK